MNIHVEVATQLPSKRLPILRDLGIGLIGSFIMVVVSQVAIHLGPVPITMQTFGIFWLAFHLGGRRSAIAMLLYLVEASLGLPVFAKFAANPLWVVGPGAGFLLAFPLAAYLTGKLVELKAKASPWRLALAAVVGNLTLWLIGIPWLHHFVGSWQAAFWYGCGMFIPGALVKVILAIYSYRGTQGYIDRLWSSHLLR